MCVCVCAGVFPLNLQQVFAPGGGPGSPDLRVLVLTDGQNNAGAAPQEALKAVNDIGTTVDAILVGDNPDADLRRIVSATEGECYQIRHLGEAGGQLIGPEFRGVLNTFGVASFVAIWSDIQRQNLSRIPVEGILFRNPKEPFWVI